MSDHQSTQQLIERIESKDRKFRTAQAIFMLLLFTALVAVIFVQFRTLDTVRQQLVTSKATAAETSKQSDRQRKIIIRRLDCMVAFFSQPDRANLKISDIDKCSIDTTDDPSNFFHAPANNSSTTTNGDGSKTTTTQTTPGNPGATNSQPSTQPVPTPTVVEPRPPAEILGVPVCVPFTGICVR